MAEDATAAPPEGSGRPRPGGDGESTTLEVGDALELLAERRDRYVLYYLRLGDGVADLDALVRQVLAWEAGERPSSFPPARVSELVEEFAVERLPRLRSAGLVEYNLKTGCVVATVEATAVYRYLDVALDDEPFVLERTDPFVY